VLLVIIEYCRQLSQGMLQLWSMAGKRYKKHAKYIMAFRNDNLDSSRQCPIARVLKVQVIII